MTTILRLEATQDHLAKVAATSDPIKAISEFVWNALDPDAREIRVEFPLNPLGVFDTIRITDDGTGISDTRAREAFRDLGDSWKKRTAKTTLLKRAMHGKEGRGRLRFYSYADRATWETTFAVKDELYDLSIHIDAGALATSSVSDAVPSSASHTGTIVELTALKEGIQWLRGNTARQEFTAIFAPYLLQYPDIQLFYADQRIDTAEAILRAVEFPPAVVHAPNRTIKDLVLKVIEWNSGDGGRKINLGKIDGVILGSIPANVTAPDFNFSAYAYSSFFQEVADRALIELGELNDEDYTFVLQSIRDRLSDYFRKRHSERAGSLIEELKQSGAYPYEGDPKNEIETSEREVFNIATYTVASFSKDFKRAESSVQRIALTLMKEALRNNPESLTNILRAVVKLPKARQDEFSQLLEKTELGKIIAASNLVANRVTVIEVLKKMVFDKGGTSSKERGELDVLIRDNTWIFGETFHLTVPEIGLTKLMQRVSDDLGSGSKPTAVRKRDGKIGRIDQMLGRSVPHPDPNKREYLLLELKRPAQTLGRKELQQVEEYLLAISTQNDFRHTDTSWIVVLVGGDYDEYVKARITQANRAVGIAHESGNAKVLVRTWAELIRDCEGRLSFIQQQLRFNIADAEIKSRIASLKSAVLKTEAQELERA